MLGYCYLFVLIGFLFSPLIISIIIYSFNPYKNIWGWLYIILMCLPIFPFILSTLISFRVLFKNGSPPNGKYLNRSEFPKLFNLIDEITNQLKVPNLKNVVLNEELNASVVQVSKLGIFGWYENYLTLGIPLMASLSDDEFRSVLVHEIGHLSGNHSRFNGWIFRLRETLNQMQECMQKVNEGHPSIFITPFIRAHYLLGKILLQGDNKNGIKHLEKALNLNPNYTEDCLRLLYQFCWECGEVKKANRYRDRLDAFYVQLNQAQIERSTANHKDKYLPHQLERTEIIKIKEQISQFSQIKEVYLVQKQVNYLSHIPFYILGVVRKCSFFYFELEDGAYKLQIALKKQVEIPGDCEISVVGSRNHIRKQIREIKNSLIYMKK